MGGRILCLVLPLVGVALSVSMGGATQPAGAEHLADVAPKPSPEAKASFALLLDALKRVQEARSTDRAELLDVVFAQSGSFLDAHAVEASPYQLRLAAGYWLQLAEERGQLGGMQARVRALRRLPSLPPDLAIKLTFTEGRLATRVGNQAPAWSAARLDGSGSLASRDLSGIVLISFWATWNPHCRDLVQQRLAPLALQYAKTLTVVHVGVSTNGETTARELDYFRGAPCNGEKVFDADATLAKAFGADGTPLLCLIGADGRILVRGPGWDAIAKVERRLARN